MGRCGGKVLVQYVCNPEFREACEFRGESGECFWEGKCNQKRLKFIENGRLYKW